MLALSDFMSDAVHLDFLHMATPLLQTLALTAGLCREACHHILSIVNTLNCIFLISASIDGGEELCIFCTEGLKDLFSLSVHMKNPRACPAWH